MDLGRRTSLSSSLVLKGLTMLGQALSSFLYIGRFIRIRDWLGELEGALPKPLQNMVEKTED